ncbi:ChrR family anti-sigma-E factor [uncultured Litoreibacter sp.]|uniref:ChrR family anti-sigma-E factor n=1 Tax=uncultured Litoreibacter sp. TaxID=1392394 RepID=UPI00260FBC98|nr:ChrR family anti-sigma-E factor [uncultured Litoreibacter sp.]
MTDVKHHLTDELLMAYAAGTLAEAFNLVVATHITLCDECRARLGAFEAVGGALLEDADEVEVSADMEAIFAKIAATNSEIQVTPASTGVFPSALQDYVGGDLDAFKWRPVGMGVKQAILKTSKTASVRLLRIPAGAAMPDHGHNGTELTLVLKGAFKDEHDRFARGDIEIATEADHHTPIAEAGEDCICLSATDAPLKFRGLLPRIAQRFARI